MYWPRRISCHRPDISGLVEEIHRVNVRAASATEQWRSHYHMRSGHIWTFISMPPQMHSKVILSGACISCHRSNIGKTGQHILRGDVVGRGRWIHSFEKDFPQVEHWWAIAFSPVCRFMCSVKQCSRRYAGCLHLTLQIEPVTVASPELHDVHLLIAHDVTDKYKTNQWQLISFIYEALLMPIRKIIMCLSIGDKTKFIINALRLQL